MHISIRLKTLRIRIVNRILTAPDELVGRARAEMHFRRWRCTRLRRCSVPCRAYAVKLPILSFRFSMAEHVDLPSLRWWHLNSTAVRDCLQMRASLSLPLSFSLSLFPFSFRGSLISLIQLFFRVRERKRNSEREWGGEDGNSATFFFRPLVSFLRARVSFSTSSFHFLRFLWSASRGSPLLCVLSTWKLRRFPTSSSAIWHLVLRRDIELFNLRLLSRSATRDIRCRYLGRGTSCRGWFRVERLKERVPDSNENCILPR